MIIRRKHTANFTTIGNTLFNDERLAADELGILAFLRSKPHDWEVRRPALARRFKLGRDSIKRIIHSFLRTGWVIAYKTRLSNGTFHVVYEVRDEPGPELSDEEVKAALSLVSSGASQDDSADDDGPESLPQPGQPPTENPSWSAGQPSLAEPSPVNPSRPIETLQNKDSQKTESTKAVRDFAELRKGWPSDHVLSEVACEAAFAGLTDDGKAKAIKGSAPYLAECATKKRLVCDLVTYIRERRGDRFADRPPNPTPTLIQPNTPNWYRWLEHWEAVKPEQAQAMDTFKKMGRDWWAPSPWPPPKSQSAA